LFYVRKFKILTTFVDFYFSSTLDVFIFCSVDYEREDLYSHENSTDYSESYRYKKCTILSFEAT